MDKKKEKLFRIYTTWIAENKKRPEFIEAFVIEADSSENEFKSYFDSFEALEKAFWLDHFQEAVTRTSQQDEYAGYSINEKLLAYYFTWIEILEEHREYVVFAMENCRFYEIYPPQMADFKKYFEDVIGQLVDEGTSTMEIANRPLITERYKYMLWSQPVAIIRFWVRDTGENYENTDALIEKTVNFSFDMMRSNSLDSFVDLAKFHLQHR